jgi:hypothetical protein
MPLECFPTQTCQNLASNISYAAPFLKTITHHCVRFFALMTRSRSWFLGYGSLIQNE